ncbi:PorV/PorQ family protein [candidate division KSB1 bacterium]|nr:PorV/PorQ family protein [candidate division KSB1 bacterium]RQW00491.1 MAG: PorV/PorQ family protein [candidate division KSB1 bacterium]
MKNLRNLIKTSIKIRYGTAILLCLLLLAPQAGADNSGVGYHGAPFLKISPAARQVAMGGAYTALSGDINLMRYNVGGLGGLQYPSLAFNFNDWIGDTNQGNIAFGLPTRYGAFGIDFTFFNEGKIIALDENFEPTGDKPSSGDMMISFGYGLFFPLKKENAKNWWVEAGVGLAGKYLTQTLVGQTTAVSGIDAGVQLFFHPPKNSKNPILSLGAGVQNYGLSKVKFDRWESPLPESYRFGAAIDFQRFPMETWELIVSSDAIWTRREKIRYQLGTELFVNKVFSLRGGYKFNDPSISKWALGFGVYMPTSWLGSSLMRLDYAFAPLTAFEDDAAHRFSLHFAFGAVKKVADIFRAEDLEALKNMAAKQDSLDAALLAAKEAEARLKALEKEMRERLAKIQAIADESEGRIEIESLDDGKTIKVTLRTDRVNFDFDRANIRPDDFPTMRQLGEILNTYPEAKVQLSGHTDWIGTDHYNIHLSHRRVDSVMTYLSVKENVNPDRFYMPVGYGESKPIADNRTDAGRAMNRRVEFLIYTYDAQPKMPEGTAIKDLVAVDQNTIHIVCNGNIEKKIPLPLKTMVLDNPQRFAMDFDKIYLIAKQKEFPLNIGPVTRARAAEHIEEDFTRVVLDVTRLIDPEIRLSENKIIIRLR